MFYSTGSDADKITLIDIYSTPFSDLFKSIDLALMSDTEIIKQILLLSG